MFKGLMHGRDHTHHAGVTLGDSGLDGTDPAATPQGRSQGWRARWRWGRRRGLGGARGSASYSPGAGAMAGDADTCCEGSSGPGHCHRHGAASGGHAMGRPLGGHPGHGPNFEGRSLNDINPGQGCRIFALHGRGAIRQRLMDMGLVPNATLTVVRCAPLNDPIEVQVGATLVSVRRAEAARIEVVHA